LKSYLISIDIFAKNPFIFDFPEVAMTLLPGFRHGYRITTIFREYLLWLATEKGRQKG